jgi:hypothetical protein
LRSGRVASREAIASLVGFKEKRPDPKSVLNASRGFAGPLEISVDQIGPPHLVHLKLNGYTAHTDIIYLKSK